MSHRPSSLFRLSTKAFSVGLCISSASRGWSNACIFVFCGEKNDFPKTSSRKKRAQLEKTKLLSSLSLLLLLLLLWLLQLFSFLPTLLLSCDIHIEIDIFFTQMFHSRVTLGLLVLWDYFRNILESGHSLWYKEKAYDGLDSQDYSLTTTIRWLKPF